LRSNEISKINDLESMNIKYIVIGQVKKNIKNEISNKVVDLKDIDSLVLDNKEKIEYTMIDKNQIEIDDVKKSKPIVLNYEYNNN
jgi:hypothetical protein